MLPHPVTVYVRGPIKGYTAIYNHIIIIIQLLLRGGSTQCLGFAVGSAFLQESFGGTFRKGSLAPSYMYIYVYVCLYVGRYVCMYVRMYVCM